MPDLTHTKARLIDATERGRRAVPKRGTFRDKQCRVEGGSSKWHVWRICVDCEGIGAPHAVVTVPGPSTDRTSTWGVGIPTTMRICLGCSAMDGPWVSSGIVGEGW